MEVDPEDSEILGTYPFEVQTPRMHDSRPKREGMTARGNLRRMTEKPQGERNRRSRRP